MGPFHTCPWGWGAGRWSAPSPPGPLCFHPGVPCCPQHPCSAAGHPASPPPASGHPLSPLRASPALQMLPLRLGPNGGCGRTPQPGRATLPGSSVPSTSWGASRTRPPLPHGRAGPLSSCQPSSARGLSTWLFPLHAWRARPGPALRTGLHRLSVGPGRQLGPRSPRTHPQGLGALGWVRRPVMAPPREFSSAWCRDRVRPGGGAVPPATAGKPGLSDLRPLTCPSRPHTCTRRGSGRPPGRSASTQKPEDRPAPRHRRTAPRHRRTGRHPEAGGQHPRKGRRPDTRGQAGAQKPRTGRRYLRSG